MIKVENLTKFFPIHSGILSRKTGNIHVVNDVSFAINKGETVGLVGESGCGKTTLGRTLLRLYEPTSGKIFFDGQDISKLPSKNMRELRKRMQLIFQDPFASLNPRMTTQNIIEEPLTIHTIGNKKERKEFVLNLANKVGLKKEDLNKYPHEFSGGQRQRIGIARALAIRPDFIVCDEPVSALDVSIQAQIINLLSDLQEEFNLTYLFISHDLKVVEHISNRIMIMYLGKIVEVIDSDKLFSNFKHPYTEALLSAIPTVDPLTKKKRIILEGDVPSPITPPSGCYFHPRCFKKIDICNKVEPKLREIASNHCVACHLY